MADQEHYDIFMQGTSVWNQWREECIGIRPDLNGIYLSHVDLSGANLSGANLNEVDLKGANLSDANLINADLSDANLKDANLGHVDLRGADLRGADLRGADLSDAFVGGTVFASVDLSVVKGLETVTHMGPSTIGIDTIYLSHGNIPEAFLRGAGVDDTFITYIRSLVGKPIEYYSCFISYSSLDEAFARRVHADLQSQNVRCWFAPEDLKIGEKFWQRIDESIRLYDKLLVVLSQHSIESDWVEREVLAALEKERLQKKTVLFPITLDETFKNTFTPWAADIRRSRHTSDFMRWKEHDEYEKSFQRLLRDLKSAP